MLGKTTRKFLVLAAIAFLVAVVWPAVYSLNQGVSPVMAQTRAVDSQKQQVKKVVIKDLNAGLAPSAPQPKLRQLAVSSPYALATWNLGEMGGITLLVQEESSWKIVTTGGGSLDVKGLISFRVPEKNAQALYRATNPQKENDK